MVFRLLVIAFFESFATICVERGVYFFAEKKLHFTAAMNLWVALGLGVMYIVGATASHPLSIRLREKPLLLATVAGQALVHLAMSFWPVAAMMFAGSAAIGLLNGMKWPLIESFINAGQTPRQQAATVGRFNISWALPVPLAMFAAGPLIQHWPSGLPSGLFLLPAAINVACLVALAMTVPTRPAHLPVDHPQRPNRRHTVRLRALMLSSRWLMLGSYGSMFILAPLMPEIFSRLHQEVERATALSGVMDVVRVLTFVLLWRWEGWHGRPGVLVASLPAMIVGFFMILFGADAVSWLCGPNIALSLAVVLSGQVLFGFAGGMVYYAALYYVMVIKNAAVDAGGGHEGLIGLGFALGPMAGLAGIALAPVLGSAVLGNVAGISPLIIICSAAACWPLIRARRILKRIP